MPMESVYPRLEPLLPQVRKPIQYVGGELNSVVSDWDAAEVRWALMYPDAYEVGLPNQGIQILYEVLNEADGVLAERTYSVWPDLAALMRSRGIPQPIAEFGDGAVLGDGEQAVLAISALIKEWKRDGRPGGRDGLLERLAI